MELNTIKRVVDVDGGYGSESAKRAERRVNEYLDEGWILLNTYRQNYGGPGPENTESIHYVLGNPNIQKG